jgi:surface protein
MFTNASLFNQDLSGWDVGRVTSKSEFDNQADSWLLPRPAF